MIKAEIKMKDGTHIIIDGSEEEIKKIISTISGEKGSRKKAIKTIKATVSINPPRIFWAGDLKRMAVC